MANGLGSAPLFGSQAPLYQQRAPEFGESIGPVEQDRGAFMSFLDWLDRPGQAIRHTLTGDLGTAGRHLVDFIGEIPDAVLPGDVIPQATSAQDFMAPSELLGMSEDTTPWLRIPADIAVGLATDPLTYLTFGGAGAARNIARQAAGADKYLQAGVKAEDAATLLQRNLSPAGREQLGRDPSFLDDLIERSRTAEVVDDAGDVVDAGGRIDYNALADLVRGDQAFEQGGVRTWNMLGGRQLTNVDPLQFLTETIGTGTRALWNKLPEGTRADVARGTMGIREAAAGVGEKIKQGLGWTDPGPLREVVRRSTSAAGLTTKAGQERINQIFSGVTKEEDRALTSIFNNYIIDPTTGKPGDVLLGQAGDELIDAGNFAEYTNEAIARLRNAGYANIDPERVGRVVEDILEFNQMQIDNLKELGAWRDVQVFMRDGVETSFADMEDMFKAARSGYSGFAKTIEAGADR